MENRPLLSETDYAADVAGVSSSPPSASLPPRLSVAQNNPSPSQDTGSIFYGLVSSAHNCCLVAPLQMLLYPLRAFIESHATSASAEAADHSLGENSAGDFDDVPGAMSRQRGRRSYAPPRRRVGTTAESAVVGNDVVVGGEANPAAAAAAAVPLSVGSGEFSIYMDDSGSQYSSTVLSSTRRRQRRGDRWIMQRGVLVRVTADGTQYHNGSAGPGGGFDGGGGGEDQLYQSQSRYSRTSGTFSALSPEAAALLAKLDAGRESLCSLDALSAALDRLSDYLPVRLEVEMDPAMNGGSSAHGALKTTRCSFFCLHVIGPLQVNAAVLPEVLGIVEDILLDDCCPDSLALSSLHYSDLYLGAKTNVHRHGGGVVGFTKGSDLSSTLPYARSSGVLQSNAVLDALEASDAPQEQLQHSLGAARAVTARNFLLSSHNDSSDSADAQRSRRENGVMSINNYLNSSTAAAAELAEECETRLSVLLRNIAESSCSPITAVRLTRCSFSPWDLGRTLPLCLGPQLRYLVFEQCPLTPAHTDSLVLLARSVTATCLGSQADLTANHTAAAGGGTGGGGAGAMRGVALGGLVELQVCGSLTPESVTDLLNYFYEEMNREERALRVVRVPSMVQAAALQHPLVIQEGVRVEQLTM